MMNLVDDAGESVLRLLWRATFPISEERAVFMPMGTPKNITLRTTSSGFIFVPTALYNMHLFIIISIEAPFSRSSLPPVSVSSGGNP